MEAIFSTCDVTLWWWWFICISSFSKVIDVSTRF